MGASRGMRLIVWPPVPIKQARSGCVFCGLRRDRQRLPAVTEPLKCRKTDRVARYGGNQPEKAVFAIAIARAGFGAAIRVRVIAANDRPSVRACHAQRAKMIGGIDFETVGIFGNVARGMQGRDAQRVAFDQAATFARKGSAGFTRDLLAQIVGKKKSGRHGLLGAIWPTRWPSLALKI